MITSFLPPPKKTTTRAGSIPPYIWYLLILIILFNAIFNGVCLLKGITYHGICDHIHHLNKYVDIEQKIRLLIKEEHHIHTIIAKTIALMNTAHNWPYLVYIVSTLIGLLFSFSHFSVHVTSSLYLIALIIAVFLLGNEWLKSPKIGLLAAFLLSMFPLLRRTSLCYGLDLPLTAMTAFFLYFLSKCNNFANGRMSVLTGVTLGIGFLTKGQILFFAIPPLLYCCWGAIRSKNKLAFLNMASAGILASAISSLWWWGNFSHLWTDLGSQIASTTRPSFYSGVFTLRGFLYIFEAFIDLSNIGFLILFIWGVFCLLKFQNVRKKYMILLSAVFPAIILYLIPCKWQRYYMPLLPFYAIILAYGLFAIRPRILRVFLISSIILFCSINHPLSFYKYYSTFTNWHNFNQAQNLNPIISAIKAQSKKNDTIILHIVSDSDFSHIYFDRSLQSFIQYAIKRYSPSRRIRFHWPRHIDYLTEIDFLITGISLNSNLTQNHTLRPTDISADLINNPLQIKAINRELRQITHIMPEYQIIKGILQNPTENDSESDWINGSFTDIVDLLDKDSVWERIMVSLITFDRQPCVLYLYAKKSSVKH